MWAGWIPGAPRLGHETSPSPAPIHSMVSSGEATALPDPDRLPSAGDRASREGRATQELLPTLTSMSGMLFRFRGLKM